MPDDLSWVAEIEAGNPGPIYELGEVDGVNLCACDICQHRRKVSRLCRAVRVLWEALDAYQATACRHGDRGALMQCNAAKAEVRAMGQETPQNPPSVPITPSDIP